MLVALAAGFVSFASPCVLPLVPGFLGYVTGLGDATLEQRRRSRLVLVRCSSSSASPSSFLALVVVASAVSFALRDHLDLLTRVGGAASCSSHSCSWNGDPAGGAAHLRAAVEGAGGAARCALLGAVFALGWAPCTGPTLAAILALNAPLAGSGGVVGRGVVLAVAYSLGLGVPFLAIAAGGRAWARRSWIRRHQKGIHLFGGAGAAARPRRPHAQRDLDRPDDVAPGAPRRHLRDGAVMRS